MPDTHVASRRLSFGTKLVYGFGNVSTGVHLAIYALLLFFYNQVVGLSPGEVSVALAVALVVDAIWDPTVGQISDNLNTRWGRRHPLMYASAIPIALTVYGLFNPPAASHAVKLIWLFSFVLASRLLLSLYEMPSAALAPELATDYDQRTSLLSYRWIFLVAGSGTITILGFLWFFRSTPHYPNGQFNPAAWGPLALTGASAMLLSILVSSLGTHRHIPTLHKPAARTPSLARNLREIGATLKNRNLCVALIASLIAGLSYGLYGGLALYLDSFLWGMNGKGLAALNMANLVSVFFSALLATWLSRQVGKKYAAVIMFFACLAAIQVPILLRLLGLAPANGSPTLLPMLIAFRFAAGVLTNGGFIMMTSMIADITEEVQLQTGRRAEGLLMSAYSFITKATTGVSTLLPALVLALAHFPAKALPGAVDPAIVRHMAWLYVPITSTLSFLSISTWMLYRIDRKAHEANLAAVQAQALADAGVEAQGEGAVTSLRAAG